MSKVYTTVQGDTLDQICAAYYGYTSGTVEAVLKANDGLARRGSVYEAGVKITLPDVDTSASSSISLFNSPDSSGSGSDSTAEELVEAHNNSTSAHPDIRASIKNRTTFADVAKATAKAVAMEAVARKAADVALASDLASEVSRAKSAENINDTALAIETSARIVADATLQTNIASEATTARAAESTNASAISVEATRAAAVEALKAPLATPVIPETTAARTLAFGDANSLIRCTSATAVTVTVPLAASVAFPVGTTILIRQAGAGQVTLAAATGVTLNTSRTLKTLRQHATIALTKIGTDEWDVTGERALS